MEYLYEYHISIRTQSSYSWAFHWSLCIGVVRGDPYHLHYHFNEGGLQQLSIQTPHSHHPKSLTYVRCQSLMGDVCVEY